jgi:hypothetical protein
LSGHYLWSTALPAKTSATTANSVDAVTAQVMAFKSLERIDDSDPMAWWSLNRVSYPDLAAVAQALLSVPASEVPSERMFSMAALTFHELRNRLSPQTLADLLFVYKNHPHLVAWREA